MKKREFNKKLGLQKEKVASLNNQQMNDAIGGKVPATTNDTYYTEVIQNGYCVQPAPGNNCAALTEETICYFDDGR